MHPRKDPWGLSRDPAALGSLISTMGSFVVTFDLWATLTVDKGLLFAQRTHSTQCATLISAPPSSVVDFPFTL